ncbi:glycosyltransferase family 4 protein [Corynebacterium sp. LK2510]|uniref:glycosyltransferase family 4 protein n=1 Tax=Corynebacterium sp. LK2510 TaxID=3110472 RepID=UPI0034CE1A6D
MRVGLICPYSFDEPGGVQAHVLDLAHSLRSRGHDAYVLGPATAGRTRELPDWVTRGGPAVPLPYNGSVARLALGPQVRMIARKFIRGGNFDVLHIHEPNATSYSLAALLAAEGPIVATYHASAQSSLALRAALPTLRIGLEKIRGGIAVSEMARRWQVQQVGTDPVVIPNGVDTGRFARRAQPQARRGETVHIAFLGRLAEPRKGLGILLDALEMLGRDVRVTVIGGGDHPSAPGVDFVGRVSDEDKARILGEADIYVAPNTGGESFGIVLVEAMAAGCAVVASDLDAFAAVCAADQANPAGVLFPTGDAAALANELRALIDDPARRQRLAQAGAARAAHYDWAVVTDQILAVYETVSHNEKVRVG